MPNFQHYHWISYAARISEKLTKLDRSTILEWFGGRESFIAFHEEEQDVSKVALFSLEE